MRAEVRRVLMTADAVGGVWTYALDLARALTPSDIHFVIATMGPPPSAAQRAEAATIPNVQLVTSEFQLEWMDAPWDDVARAGDWLLELEARVAPDLIHLNGYAHGSLPFSAPVLVAGHSCVLSWADAVPGAIAPAKLSAYADHVRSGIRAADFVVAPTRAMLDALQRHYGPLRRTMVVHNGRREGLFQPGRKEPFLFTAGRLWDPAKNTQMVASIASTLPWPTAVAGADAIDVRSAAAAHRGVRMLGTLDSSAMAEWLGRASILVLPARYEPFGLLPLEAALSGCALVLGNIASLREVWGDAADFVPPGDPNALADTVRRLIDSPRRLTGLAAAARVRAGRYSLDAMAAGYLRAYGATAAARLSHGAVSCAS